MNMKTKFELILASQSPRRRELLGHTGLKFTAISLDVDETATSITPKEVALEISGKKIKGAHQHCDKQQNPLNNPFYIVSDTLVTIDDQILGKPQDKSEARAMLNQLAGREHTVYTSVGFTWKNEQGEWKEHYFVDAAKVTFDQIDDRMMDIYLDTGESMDKAGAYGIQGPALVFIGDLKGSYSTVMGFPLSRFMHEIENLLNQEFQFNGHWRELFNS